MDVICLFGRHPGAPKAVDKSQSHRPAFRSIFPQQIECVLPECIVKSQAGIAEVKVCLGHAIIEVGRMIGGTQCPAIAKAKSEISLFRPKDPF